MGPGPLQVRHAGVSGVLVLGETLFVPLGCFFSGLLNKLLKDLYLSPSACLSGPSKFSHTIWNEKQAKKPERSDGHNA